MIFFTLHIMMLEVNNLQCIRGDRELFSHLSFQLDRSQLMMLEGKNGSGKTTLLRALCGLYLPDEGEIRWKGLPIAEQDEAYRQALFYLGHLNAIKSDLTVIENLRLNTQLMGYSPSDDALIEALDTIGLYAFEDYPCNHLSQGQKRRVALARLLVNQATLWVLDEPFVALDTAAVTLLQSILAQHVEKGGMVILTTHQEVPLTSGKIKRLSLHHTHQNKQADRENA